MQKLDILKMGNMYNLRPHSPSPMVPKVEPGVYNIQIDPEKGIFLNKVTDHYLVPDKIWGKDSRTAIDTVVDTLNKRVTSMGAILSGTMGSGKTMTAECICNKIIAGGGVIVQVNSNYPPTVLETIRSATDGLLVYYFPEFTTNYSHGFHRNPDVVDQSKMLEFFSNQTLSKSLFLLTLNNVSELSPMILNRPGRFLYHIRYVGVDDNVLSEIIDDLKASTIVASWLKDYVRKLGKVATIDQVLEIIRATRGCTTENELSEILKILNIYRSVTRLTLTLPTDPSYVLTQALENGVFDPVTEVLEFRGIAGNADDVVRVKIGQRQKISPVCEILINYARDVTSTATNFSVSVNNRHNSEFP